MVDLTSLKNKIANRGTTPAGRLSAQEWNTLVSAVEECVNAVDFIKDGMVNTVFASNEEIDSLFAGGGGDISSGGSSGSTASE